VYDVKEGCEYGIGEKWKMEDIPTSGSYSFTSLGTRLPKAILQSN